MKMINYGNAISANFQRLLADPETIAKKLGITLISSTYGNAEQRAAMAEALVVWMGMNPSSAFYSNLEDKMRWKGVFSIHDYRSARDGFAQDLLLSTLASKEATSRNTYLNAACMYMALTENVARKWLWHENVDFQSCESFLRRLTKAQYKSLVNHYQLAAKAVSADEIKKLPCFTDGMLNKVWRLFNITNKVSERMETKSAIAHDFLGMGMGFGLYPNANEDYTAQVGLASQFLSKEDRGEFEVNKEHGGLYWFLYRTLRSNSLWRKNKEVKLGKWICPGFWFTMIIWSIFLIASPVSLASATYLYAAKGIASTPLFVLGAIFPMIFALSWAKAIGGKAYDSEYLKILFVLLMLFVVGSGIYEVVMFAKDLPSFYVGILSVVLLLPYCISKDTGRFWDAPVLGKVLPIAFVGALLADTYNYSGFLQFCFTALVWLATSIAEFFLEYWRAIALVLTAVSLYAMVCWGLVYLSMWMMKKTESLIEHSDRRVYAYERTLNWGMVIVLVAMATMIYRAAPLYSEGVTWQLGLGVLLLVLPFMTFLTMSMFFRGVDVLAKKRMFGYALAGARGLSDKQFAKVDAAIRSNAFWGDVAHFGTRAAAIKNLFWQTPCVTSGYVFPWIIEIVRLVKDDSELSNATRFTTTSALFKELPAQPSLEILELILSGAKEGDIFRAINRENERLKKIVEKPSAWVEYVSWADGILSSIRTILYRMTWPLRMVWKGIGDIYRLWKSFNEQCPPAPPNERPVAQ